MSVPNWTTVLAKTHLDAGSDDPSQARQQLEALLDIVNEVLQSRGVAGGLADLDDGGKVVAARLANVIGSTELQNGAVTQDKVGSSAISFDKFKATITSSTAAPTGGVNGDMHFIYVD